LLFDATVNPAHQGFEKTLCIIYGLAEDGHANADGTPKNLFHSLLLMRMGEVGYPGLMGWVFGMVGILVGIVAWVTGEEERLTRKYYGKPISQATDEEKRKYLKKEL
jgi:hypothetical protein